MFLLTPLPILPPLLSITDSKSALLTPVNTNDLPSRSVPTFAASTFSTIVTGKSLMKSKKMSYESIYDLADTSANPSIDITWSIVGLVVNPSKRTNFLEPNPLKIPVACCSLDN